ncbi:MAG: 2-oxoglutarate dehydrogenase complex dihydrolipoyllysine-residue succinyltransferase [Betaproteobacteria bacterium]|nr:2-oxoglutarate dehydrogenase complex dihydrolipoyllysine-residue succinyltransferase [Betaproteobacteria bacterium]
MMLVEVKVPQLSESVAEATLLTWRKREGERVARDENLIDIETDKVVLELPAPQAGVIAKIIKGDGDIVVSGEVIATIDTDAKSEAKSAALESARPQPVKSGTPSREAAPARKPANEEAKLLPAARKMIAETGINPQSIPGTGRGGRITKGDIIQHLEGEKTESKVKAPAESAKAPAEPALPPKAEQKPPMPPLSTPVVIDRILGDRSEQRVPMSRLRARIAERLVQSQSTAAILTTFNEVNMQPVMELRTKFKDRFEKEHGIKLGFMSFFVKAVVAALKKFPVVNASIDGNDIVYHGYIDIGIAVGSPRGLVVPILRDADQMSFAEIEERIADFGKRAQEGKLGIEELTGGTFSISNGGVFGSMLSTPIINPPQSAILGIHATKDRPVVENGQIVIRPMNYLAMSYDHRIIDGREAVLSLVAVKEALEDPARMLLEL